MSIPSERYDARPAALRPLLETFWSSQGWREPPAWPPGDVIARAVEAGVMFPKPRVADHDGWVQAAREAAAGVTAADVAAAFVASLTSRRLDLRSALGSFAVARVLPDHSFAPRTGWPGCGVCGQPVHRREEDLNVLNFERFKWGGVRRDDIRYVAFDLEQFARAPREAPGDEALAVGWRLVTALRNAAPEATASRLATQLRMVRGNTDERAALLDILGVCGVLRTREHPGYATGFVAAADRELPPRRYVDRSYPVCWWKGRDGVDEDALRLFLPQLAR
jgi:hypothetical protein